MKDRIQKVKVTKIILGLATILIIIVIQSTNYIVKPIERKELKFVLSAEIYGVYSKKELDDFSTQFVDILNASPDLIIREQLIEVFRNGNLPIIFTKTTTVMIFDANRWAFGVNPEVFSKHQKGYIWSYLVHENVHLQDFLGVNENGLLYNPCEKEDYQSYECKMEWWEAEHRAWEKQISFLKENELIHVMTTGPRVNNRAIVKNYKTKRAALEMLRYNYYPNYSISKDLLKIFPEFYRRKLLEIG